MPEGIDPTELFANARQRIQAIRNLIVSIPEKCDAGDVEGACWDYLAVGRNIRDLCGYMVTIHAGNFIYPRCFDAWWDELIARW